MRHLTVHQDQIKGLLLLLLLLLLFLLLLLLGFRLLLLLLCLPLFNALEAIRGCGHLTAQVGEHPRAHPLVDHIVIHKQDPAIGKWLLLLLLVNGLVLLAILHLVNLALGTGRQVDSEGESAAMAQMAGAGDRTLHGLAERLGDLQAKTRSTESPCDGRIALCETLHIPYVCGYCVCVCVDGSFSFPLQYADEREQGRGEEMWKGGRKEGRERERERVREGGVGGREERRERRERGSIYAKDMLHGFRCHANSRVDDLH